MWGAGVSLLARRWAGIHPAVFEADVYAQNILHGLSGGGLAPWDLTGRFWPFFFIAPGIYLHVPAFALVPGGRTALALQAMAVGITAVLLSRLAARAGLRSSAAAGLGLVWLLHPIGGGVAMAWGWSPYASAAPLLVAGIAALLPLWAPATRRARRPATLPRRTLWTALALLAGAALMKVNAAIMVAGLGAWLLRFHSHRRGAPGWTLAVGGALWVGLTGALFVAAAQCAGTFAEDVHLGGPSPVTASGLLTLLVTLLPALPLLDRRGWALVGLATGVELTYTGFVNPANSGLVPASAVILAAGATAVVRLPRPGLRVALAVVLAAGAHLAFQPPRLAPLPLQPAAFAYTSDPTGAAVRAWVDALPDDATLVTFDPLNGATGEHPGRMLEPDAWEGRGQVAVILAEPVPKRFHGCLAPLMPQSTLLPPIWAGVCGSGDWARPPATDPLEECTWTGAGSTRTPK